MKKINTPLTREKIKELKRGEEVLLSGIIYTARDQAHKRLIQEKRPLPGLKDAVIYYCGPTPAVKGKVIGSCGPTTSSRMDEFTPALLKKGVSAMIGKGRRSGEVIQAIKKYGAVYFLTYAGCGALLSKYIKKSTVVAYKDLGPEAIYKLEVKDFPLIVGIDATGKSLYKV
ncbi:MAG: FumA C-terminus/TtdB family hydratase beta subunit [Candidatus Omnitrophica bacterium]|nr:FumA C-terminus/TtdB family hydratase beta subunit [Candidatus Omnitrophota bacterium]MDD5592800.1 FumA C-terminus/TtdB family hydratase beta subunit [Candidatus Omnitrophota bacterium]